MADSQRKSPEGMSNDEMTKDIWTALYGDHSENKPGLLIRIDRLEGKMKIIIATVATAVGAGLTAVVTSIWGWLSAGVHKP